MLGRELTLVLRARITWFAAALSALLVGHGFVLAVDLYSAGSRSALAHRLLAHELDPLAGIVRPTLGGLYLAVSLLGPLVAARTLAVEKERRTFHALLLATAAPARLTGAKLVASLAGVSLQLVAPMVLAGLWCAVGGHLAAAESLVALLGYALYLALVVALATAAAAFTDSLAQAATLALVVVAASWAIDASEGFAALAWLGRALDWSVTTHLAPMERGTLAVGACAWMAVMAGAGFGFAWIGVRDDLPRWRRGALVLAATVLALAAGAAAHRVRASFDLTEGRRGSLPVAVARGLAALPAPLTVEIYLDRDDARRRQIESDVIDKLRLARPDLAVRTPTDERDAPSDVERDGDYGRVVVRVGAVERETTSSSPEEIVRLFFLAAGRPEPEGAQPDYSGYPWVVEGARRTFLCAVAYAGLPLSLACAGLLLTRPRRRRP